MTEPILKVSNVSKSFMLSERDSKGGFSFTRQGKSNEEFWALKNIDFHVHKGDVVGIIGKNGSGKSTLLKILGGITKPTAGTITARGKLTAILEIGTGFHPDLTGRENIFFYGRMLGMSKAAIQGRMPQIIDFSGIGKFIDTPLKYYSNGMYLRLAMSVIIHSEVRILMVDEMLSVGDAEFRMKMYEKVQSMLHSESTILMVSHSMTELLQLCNKCILLEAGKIVFEGTPSETISNYMESAIAESAVAGENKMHVLGTDIWEWKVMQNAPGSEEVRLHRVTIKAKGRPGNEIYIEDAIEIEVEFWKLKTGMTVQLFLLFNDMTNNPIFYVISAHNLSGEAAHQMFGNESGLFCLKCELPGNFLNQGFYTMQVVFTRDTTAELYRHKDQFRFKIHKNPKMVYYDNSNVILHPSVNWSHIKISSL